MTGSKFTTEGLPVVSNNTAAVLAHELNAGQIFKRSYQWGEEIAVENPALAKYIDLIAGTTEDKEMTTLAMRSVYQLLKAQLESDEIELVFGGLERKTK